ncbi:MAG: M20/M25/M40 family metallo-hydrolase [Ignavibacteria bacterium]|nr:M20/M25/M40 family metallo-hydrolase [Ignavibacteria bacterium]
MKPTLMYLIFFYLVLNSFAQITKSEIDKSDIKQHLQYLASDDLKGRGTGTQEIEVAAKYIAKQFERFGLEPLGDTSYFQYFQVTTGVELGKNNYFKLMSRGYEFNLKLNEDYSPAGISQSGKVYGELVFAGYGIEANKLNYNDYKDIDVKDKIAVVLRYTPEGDKPTGKFAEYSSLRYKCKTARDKGAKGVIFITGPNTYENDSFIKLTVEQMGGDAGLVVLSTTTQKAEELFGMYGLNLKSLQQKIDSTLTPNSFEFDNVECSIGVELIPIKKWAMNVIGTIRNENAKYSNQYLVIGAHYDHLGMGGANSLSTSKQPEIHNGADDNASGTSSIIEIAERFSKERKNLKRNIIFIAFSGEEMGLLGSANFVKNPKVPLENVVAMFNLDMVGRLDEKNSLTVYGTGTSPVWKTLLKTVDSLSSYNFKLNFIDDGYGPSDHSSFYSKNIPVLFFFTGTHKDYHRPSDDYDKINYEGMEKVCKYVYEIAYEIVQQEEKIAFTKTQGSEPREGVGRGFRVYVGTIPDFSEQADGFKISGVGDGSPAEKAGLKAGDIIQSFGGKQIKNIYDFTYALQEHKPGDEVEVTIKRGEDILTLKVLLGMR